MSQRRHALSAKANKGKFAGLRAEKPARANAAPTTKNSGKDFVYGVLFVSLVVFTMQKPYRNGSAASLQIATGRMISLARMGETVAQKRQFTHIFNVCARTAHGWTWDWYFHSKIL